MSKTFKCRNKEENKNIKKAEEKMKTKQKKDMLKHKILKRSVI